ncbi:MAG TPA: hypothetical protein VJS15_05335 [Allosphingosinicella sp.]|nr:hypothetical protein [Allosphingosinicella sp.]
MSSQSDSGRRRVDAAAKEAFIAALRDGAHRDEAARLAGFTAEAFYYARRKDGLFRQAWLFALELSAIDARAARSAGVPGDVPIAPNSNRPLQARAERRRRFDDRRKRIFLDHFAGTADAHAACDAAGVSYSAYTAHRRKDPEFAAACDEALAVAVAALEAEAVRQRLDAQRNLREGLCPAGGIAKEFERVMLLLARYDRQGGRSGLREVRYGRMKRWSFDEAIAALDRHLRALGARHGIEAEPIMLPPPSGAGGAQ